MGSFPRDDLTRRTGVAALLFRLEQPLSSQEFKERSVKWSAGSASTRTMQTCGDYSQSWFAGRF
jgi:hypothetical protein